MPLRSGSSKQSSTYTSKEPGNQMYPFLLKLRFECVPVTPGQIDSDPALPLPGQHGGCHVTSEWCVVKAGCHLVSS